MTVWNLAEEWHRFRARARQSGQVLTRSTLHYVGLGVVFVLLEHCRRACWDEDNVEGWANGQCCGRPFLVSEPWTAMI